MTQLPVIIESSDAWLLDATLPAVRRRGVVYVPNDAALATQEIASVHCEQSEREPATTLLPVLRLPQRQSVTISATAQRVANDDDDLPTVVMPALTALSDDLATAILPVPAISISTTPTQRRLEPCHYCYQCGAVLPPWREMCFAHEAHYGRGLPPPTTLAALPDGPVDLRPTLPLPVIGRRQRAG